MPDYLIGDDDLLAMVVTDDAPIYEADILRTAWVRCEHCDDADDAEFMVRTFDGAWLCGPCDAGNRAEYDEFMRTARGW